MLIYNIGGIYFKSHFDELTAVKYYLDAYNLANEEHNLDEVLMTLNNIAELFAMKKDYAESLSYLQRAYAVFVEKGATPSTQRELIVIVNLIQMYILNKQLDFAIQLYVQYDTQIQVYPRCEFSDAIISFCQLYLAHATKNNEAMHRLTQYFINDSLKETQNQSVAFTIYSDVFHIVLDKKDKIACESLLQLMGETCLHDDIEQQLRLHLCWIHFAQIYHLEDSLTLAYKQYYLLQTLANDMTNRTKSESMKEKILLSDMIKEREIMVQEKRALEARAKVDELTRLFNRSYFNQLCTAMVENPGVHTIAFIITDVDYFKEYNDFYGHMQGDQLLKRIACVLDENGNSRFFASRFGGDEFVCLCVNVNQEDIETYLNHVYDQLKQARIVHASSKITKFASISSGYAIFENNDTFNVESSLDSADTALYKAKHKGRNCYVGYETT